MEENPNVVTNYFTSAFVLDKAKLTRIINIIEDRFNQANLPFNHAFEVFHLNGKKVHLRSIDDLFALDNTIKNPIIEVKITTTPSRTFEETDPYRIQECVFSFNDSQRRNIYLSITVENSPKQASQIFAEIEEQIERTFMTNWVYKYFKGEYFLLPKLITLFTISFVPFFFFVSVILFDNSYIPTTEPPPAIEVQSFLNKAQQANNTEAKINFLFELQTEQLRIDQLEKEHWKKIDAEKAESKKSNFASLKSIMNLKILFIALPLLVIIGCIIYAIGWCYPRAVFLWGDYEQYYNTLMSRKKFIWTVIVISLSLGIIGNLFVYGLSGYIKLDS